MSASDDDDIQIIPSTLPGVPPTQRRRSSQPSYQMVPGGPDGLLVVPEHIREMSFRMQQMLIPQAEDVNLIGQMMQLKDETVNYMYLSSAASQKMAIWPMFYSTTVYYIYKLAQKRGLRPIYLHHLANVMKTRLFESYPVMSAVGNPPSFQHIIETYQQAEHGTGAVLEAQKERVWKDFEVVLGEAYHYIKCHYDKYKRPPPSLHFLIKFCILFAKFNRSSTDRFDSILFDRLQRHLPLVPRKYFENLNHHLQMALNNPYYLVTFK